MHEEVASAFAAEAIACSDAVQFGQEQRVLDIIIEGDFIMVIKKCNKNARDRSLIGTYILEYSKKESRFHIHEFSTC